MTKRVHSTVVFPTVKQYEALERDNADLLACLRECIKARYDANMTVSGKLQAWDEARALLARLDGQGESHGGVK